MGLLDAWSRRAIQRREGKVEFLSEQIGSAEDLLKRDLILEFATRPDVQRAYLAKVGFQAQSETSIALCVVSIRPDDQSIVMRVGEILRRRFAHDVALDVLFLTVEQEADLARVCKPFYRRAK